jgi:retron-type reverse transcriptase
MVAENKSNKNRKSTKPKKVNNLRHAEYYDMQDTFDNLYEQSKEGGTFDGLMDVNKLMQRSHMSYVVEFDIKGFFDNVDHSKLIKQIWALGIRDKTLIYVLKRILKAPIQLEDGTMINPEKGTPQGGIISPLLANIVLNELDWWIDGQWQGVILDNRIIPQTNKPIKLKLN